MYMHTHCTYKKKTLQILFKGIAAISVKIVALFPGFSPPLPPPSFHWTTKKLAGPENEAAKNLLFHWILRRPLRNHKQELMFCLQEASNLRRSFTLRDINVLKIVLCRYSWPHSHPPPFWNTNIAIVKAERACHLLKIAGSPDLTVFDLHTGEPRNEVIRCK